MKNLPAQPITMTVTGDFITLEYQKELLISEDTINEDLKDQPSYFAWYAVLHEKVIEEASKLKMALELLEAGLADEIRKAAALAGEKKPTEKYISEQILLNLAYQEAQLNLISTQKNLGVLKSVKEAFNHRKDMLITLASNMRAQWDANIYIKKTEIEKQT